MKSFNEWIKNLLKEDAFDGAYTYSGGHKYDRHGNTATAEEEKIIDIKRAIDLLDEIMSTVESTKNDPKYSELQNGGLEFDRVLRRSLRIAYKDWDLQKRSRNL